MLENAKIPVKISLGFAIILSLSLIISAVFLSETQAIRAKVTESNRLTGISLDTQIALSSVRLARIRGWTYLATGDLKARSEMDASFQAYDQQIAKVMSQVSLPEGRRRLETFEASVGKLRGAWQRLTTLKEGGMSLTDPAFIAGIADADLIAKENTAATAAAEEFDNQQSVAAMSEVDKIISRTGWIAGLGGVSILILGGGFAFTVGRAIARPITSVTEIMGLLADGDTSVSVPNSVRRDEIGGMFRAVSIFKENAIRAERLAEEQIAEQAAKDARGKKLEALNDAFGNKAGQAIGILASAATELQATAGGMARMSSTLAGQSGSATASADHAHSNVTTVAAATEQLYASIQEITRQVTQSTVITSQAVAEANQTGETIRGLVDASNKIGAVVNMINDIASQTNLLALNATIEAARAGDAGKGFAVVANEVKHLANQTARATGDIAEQITSMQNVTKEAVAAINRIDHTISAINEITSAIAAAVEEQGAATQEIARNVEQATQGTASVTQNINQMAQAALEAEHTSADLLSAATELGTQSELLRSEVDLFLSEVRAA